MAKTQTLFDALLFSTAETLKKMKAPLIRSRAFRAIEGAGDSFAEAKLDEQARYDAARLAFVQGDTEKIREMIEACLAIRDISDEEDALESIKNELQGPAPEELSEK